MRHVILVAAFVLTTTVAAGGQVAKATLQVVTASSGERRLTISNEGREAGSLAVPPRVSASSLDHGIKGAVWHSGGQDVAVGFKGDKSSFVVVFLRQPDGRYIAADVSRVEAVNIGAIGPDRTYRDVETVPVEWRPDREDNAVQVLLRTRVWDLSGQRYGAGEPLIITRDGRPLWR